MLREASLGKFQGGSITRDKNNNFLYGKEDQTHENRSLHHTGPTKKVDVAVSHKKTTFSRPTCGWLFMYLLASVSRSRMVSRAVLVSMLSHRALCTPTLLIYSEL